MNKRELVRLVRTALARLAAQPLWVPQPYVIYAGSHMVAAGGCVRRTVVRAAGGQRAVARDHRAPAFDMEFSQ